MDDLHIELAADRLNDIISMNFCDAIWYNAEDKIDFWEPSDEDCKKVKAKLIEFLKLNVSYL
tara:strand:+ start:796 stop:981 length:186 start_codon:yes stop_codon:yes gene_type:complete